MPDKTQIRLPSTFIEILDHLNQNVSIPAIEEKIIEHACAMFGAQWGSIKYYYGKQFFDGFSTVPPRFRLKPRKRGFSYKTIERNKPHLMSEKMIREAHPESHSTLKSIVLAPLLMDDDTTAMLSLIYTKDIELQPEMQVLLADFGTTYGRVLNMAHTFAAEKRASINREKFMSFAAHEIKNPLMALSGYTQLIQLALEQKKEINLSWLEKMNNEVGRIKSLIDELFNVRQSQEGELIYAKERVLLRPLLTQVFENFKVRNPERKVVVNYELVDNQSAVIGDEIKLTQAFINLLNNAHKYSELDTTIKVMIQETESFYEVAIKDRGIGIAPEDLSHIFKEFYRGKNGEQKKGIGVGLFLVKSIVQNHNGKISVESSLGEGTTFIVRLPKQS